MRRREDQPVIDQALRLVVPGDGGRSVTDLVSLIINWQADN